MSERLALDADFDVKMDADQKYPLLGNFFDFAPELPLRIQAELAGLPRYAGCLEKNEIAQDMLPYSSVLVAGSLIIWSSDFKSSYGFEYHPPYEVHAWLVVKKGGVEYIVDFSLPGAIERGIKMVDEIGPILVGREPLIMASSESSDWLVYEEKENILMKTGTVLRKV